MEKQELMIYKTIEKDWNEKEIQLYLKSIKDLGSRENKAQFVYFNDKIRMEFYYASNSVWWTNLEWENNEIHQIKEIPDEKECFSIANEFLKSYSLDDQYMKFENINYDSAIEYHVKNKQLDHYTTAININFNYEIDGLPIFGSGAKARIVLDGNKNVVEWYRFWRDIEPLEKRKVIPPEMIMKLFQESPIYEKMKISKLKIELFKPKLGYYTFPPRINQKFLFPVYEIRGQILNPTDINQNICEYVPAVIESPDKMKEMKIFNGYEFCGDILHYLKK